MNFFNKYNNFVLLNNKHEVDKVHSDNLNKGVNKDHPFVDLPPSALKYLVAFPTVQLVDSYEELKGFESI